MDPWVPPGPPQRFQRSTQWRECLRTYKISGHVLGIPGAPGHSCVSADFDADGNWEFAALQANIGTAGALIEPIPVDDLTDMATWVDDWHRLRAWQPNVHGLLVHTPGHWIAIVRPEGVGTSSNAALLCDSLFALPV